MPAFIPALAASAGTRPYQKRPIANANKLPPMAKDRPVVAQPPGNRRQQQRRQALTAACLRPPIRRRAATLTELIRCDHGHGVFSRACGCWQQLAVSAYETRPPTGADVGCRTGRRQRPPDLVAAIDRSPLWRRRVGCRELQSLRGVSWMGSGNAHSRGSAARLRTCAGRSGIVSGDGHAPRQCILGPIERRCSAQNSK